VKNDDRRKIENPMNTENYTHSLPPGSVLSDYRIIRVLGEGGFGITYLAEDLQLRLQVVIKEYFPNEFALRTRENTISAKSTSVGDFKKGMKRFKEEAQTLAKFNHPSIVKILGYFEANETAYFVMEYEEGVDLSHYLKEKEKLSQEEILAIIMPILEGLKEVHRHNYLHRDIKPGNILIRSNKSPVLIDFGASKYAISETSKSVTSMLTEGYAPLEQYSTDLKQQGPFTDLYAVGAVIYRMITTEVPPSSQTRSYQLLQEGTDPLKPLSELRPKGFDEAFLKAVDRSLSLKASDRPQSVQEFQQDLAGKLVRKKRESQAPTDSTEKKGNKAPLWIAASLLGIAAIGGGAYFYMEGQKLETASTSQSKELIKTTAAKAATKKTSTSNATTPEAEKKSGLYRQALRYLKGEGVGKDTAKAAEYFRNACEGGDPRGCVGLGLLHLKGQSVDKDPEKSLHLFSQSCNDGNAEGCYNAARLYAKGLGVSANMPLANLLYRKSCEKGYAKGCYRAGMNYLTGKGGPKDYQEAKKFLSQSCQDNNAKACSALGTVYAKGLGVAKDYTKAMQFFETACENNSSVGCYNLGKMYEKGRGVTTSKSTALKYYTEACDYGYKKSCAIISLQKYYSTN
jgi:serine/threonine protein kinase